MAVSEDTVESPQDHDAALSAALLRTLGATQKQAATAAGIGVRTLRRWERSPFWPEVVEEAHDRWLSGIVEKAKRSLARNLDDGDGALTKFVLERLLDEFKRPAEKVELTGKDGGPVEYAEVDPREVLAEKLEAIRKRREDQAGDGE